MTRRISFCLAAAALALGAQAAMGQADGRRIYEEQLRVRLDEQMAPKYVGVEGGGWLNFAFFNYDDNDGEKHTLRQWELRAWGHVSLYKVHQLYVRGLVGWDDWNAGDNPKLYVNDEDQGPYVERAWYQFDLAQAVLNDTGVRPEYDLRVKVGREFAEIGTSLVLSMPLDMVQIHGRWGDWQLMTILGKTDSRTDNIDLSMPVYSHQRRCIWGVEGRYTGLDNHRPFVYYLANEDHTDPDPWMPGQRYSYDSQYLGIGSEGTLFVPQLLYRTELVSQWGETFSRGATRRQDDIRAMAFDFGVEYLFDAPTSPKIMAEYIYASGDDDRSVSAVATDGGNRPGTTDRAFNAFGFRDTGIAFAPRLSNLHIYTAGASFLPFENKHRLLERLEVGSKVFFYHKAESRGAISDPAGGNNASWVGWEWDIYANWRITSDLAWTVRYGAFQPGDAFEGDNEDCRQFLYTALMFSF
jgi:hypothetical protein